MTMPPPVRDILQDLFSVRTAIAVVGGAFAAGGTFLAMRADITRTQEQALAQHQSALSAISNLSASSNAAIDSARRERQLQLDSIAQRVTALESQQRSLTELAQLFAALRVEVVNLNESNRELKAELRALRTEMPRTR